MNIRDPWKAEERRDERHDLMGTWKTASRSTHRNEPGTGDGVFSAPRHDPIQSSPIA